MPGEGTSKTAKTTQHEPDDADISALLRLIGSVPMAVTAAKTGALPALVPAAKAMSLVRAVPAVSGAVPCFVPVPAPGEATRRPSRGAASRRH